MTNEEFQAELMSDSDLSRITFTLFDKMMKDEEVGTAMCAEPNT